MDSRNSWPEVKRINNYAAFSGCLAMVIRGLGYLVVTWSTVVLLGGFVSLLQKKDFFALTIITFIQIAGVVDNLAGDKWNSAARSASGLNAVAAVFVRNRQDSATPSANILRLVVSVKQILGWIVSLLQQAVYIALFLFGAFYVILWGLYSAAGISLLRLKRHDYGDADGDPSKANMNLALDVLYKIVVVQCAILLYRRIINALVEKRLVTEVAEAYGFKGPTVTLVEDYMKETRRGCAKNPSFAKGRNLVTYAVDLMGPDKSPADYASGLTILSTIFGPLCRVKVKPSKFQEQRGIIRYLILYAPSSHIFRLLLVLSNPRSSPYGSERPETQIITSQLRETRKHAANMVLHLADGVSVEQLPQVIQCISSLISTFKEHQRFFFTHSDYAKEEEDYLERLWECLHVLYVLAANENNCRLIIHTRGLLTKIMTPLASNLYHQTDHDTWENVLKESLKVINRLTATYGHGEGETGSKLVREIETNLEMEAVETMMSVLRCDKCSQKMGTLTMGILTNLHVQMQTADKVYLIEMLVHMYTTANSRTSALEALAKLCFQDGSNATIILQVNGSAVSSFTEDLKALNYGYHSVAEILQHACLHYTNDDECLRILKESMTDVIPKVLNKILTTGALQSKVKNRRLQTKRKTETSLLSLCVTVHETLISADQHLALQFDGAIGELSLPVKLREMVERNSKPTASCLKIHKLTSRMVISMMKCRGSRYPKPDLESLVEALLKACSRNMYFIDRSMDFARGDNAAKPSTTRITACADGLIYADGGPSA
ncbi:uncharacterized protein [Aegilops tauschii subsp. strangulata]|nr:uncharacterized protein LOC109777869 [Aegilops tauschii subsp. strangulata]XP_040241838.2 uncharacterized protein LOC109777869 [Aegilops tauschii subsp. strangulata]